MDWTQLFGDTITTNGGKLDDTKSSEPQEDMSTDNNAGQSSGKGIVAIESVKQGIIEVAHGTANNESGPKYKRGRGKSFFSEAPKKVPGCDRALHKLKDYYKRYKICPYHLELSQLVVEGQSIRFCQQCGRFQLLDEFDGDRRSCRRKLEKRNERRRRYETVSDGSADMPSSEPRSKQWQSPYSQPSPSHTGNGKKFNLNGTKKQASAIDPLLEQLQSDPDIHVAPTVAYPNEYNNHAEPQTGWVPYSYQHQHPVVNPAVANLLKDIGQMPQQPQAAPATDGGLNVLLQALLSQQSPQQQQQQQPEGHSLKVETTHNGNADVNKVLRPEMILGGGGGNPHAPQVPNPPPTDMNTAHQLLSLLSTLVQQPQPEALVSQQHIATLSMKLYQAEPSQLPPHVVQELIGWISTNPEYMEMASRPGCVHLTASTLLTSKEQERLRLGFGRELADGIAVPGRKFASPEAGKDMLIQLLADSTPLSEAAIIKDGTLAARLTIDDAQAPQIVGVLPYAVPPNYQGPLVLFSSGEKPGTIGRGLICRSHDIHPTVEVVNVGPVVSPGQKMSVSGTKGADWNWMHIELPGLLDVGAYQFVLQQNCVLSHAHSIVVIDDEAALNAVRQLESITTGVDNVPEFLHKLGIVLRSRSLSLRREEEIRLAAAAGDIMAVCIARKWHALLGLVLPVYFMDKNVELDDDVMEAAAVDIATRFGYMPASDTEETAEEEDTTNNTMEASAISIDKDIEEEEDVGVCSSDSKCKLELEPDTCLPSPDVSTKQAALVSAKAAFAEWMCIVILGQLFVYLFAGFAVGSDVVLINDGRFSNFLAHATNISNLTRVSLFTTLTVSLYMASSLASHRLGAFCSMSCFSAVLGIWLYKNIDASTNTLLFGVVFISLLQAVIGPRHPSIPRMWACQLALLWVMSDPCFSASTVDWWLALTGIVSAAMWLSLSYSGTRVKLSDSKSKVLSLRHKLRLDNKYRCILQMVEEVTSLTQ